MECRSTSKRISVNTSLKNARIFDDDSWDAETSGFIIKKEPVDQEEDTDHSSSESDTEDEERYVAAVPVKKEVPDEEPHSFAEQTVSPYEPKYQNNLGKIKKEIIDLPLQEESEITNKRVKQETVNDENKINWPFAHFHHSSANGKREIESNEEHSRLEESYLDNLDPKVKEAIINTPNKMETREWSMDDSNPSPFNKELFKHFSLKQEKCSTPEPPKIRSRQNASSDSRKSARRSVFSRLSPRISPYKKSSVGETSSVKLPVKKRLGPQLSSDIPEKKRRQQHEMETDPLVLSRRQKQIDYGKNTTGYDNYLNTVPKNTRTREDPKTPNKLIKYSRRGWDGLIKQWRLRLHKYDPSDS